MHSYNGAYASRLFRLLKLSGIHFVANPLVNIHLQGRFDTYPKRRGITRVKEMLKITLMCVSVMMMCLILGIHWAQPICYKYYIWGYMFVN